MPSLGQFFASLVGFNNENSVSLINTKWDFTLLKIEAPAEYTDFGSALSHARRREAEDGPLHRTARRLAALFEQHIPSTPKLVASYGRRVSEIIEKPGVNPTGSESDGPFESFVGAHGTAIWAAATSGVGALGIYLLACLIARHWDSVMSTSIWVELVAARRTEIQRGFMENQLVPESSLLSTLQDISREDLRIWDASARSWLRSADQGKRWELKQLELTTRNFNIPFGGGSTTYERVISAWRNAMIGMEDLLCGKPQEISDASILTAIAAWHLFPNLLILREATTSVPFKDPLFPSAAVGTVGLESILPSLRGGIRWSLALSHLQHYGTPTEFESQMDTPRLPISQFRLVVLGVLFAKWRVNHREFLLAAKWIVDLWPLLSQGGARMEDLSTSLPLVWLILLVKASCDLLNAESKSSAVLSDAMRLVSLGQRRETQGGDFFSSAQRFLPPFFGLCNVHVQAGLRESADIDCGISFLRSIAEASGLTASDGIIICSHWTQVTFRDATPDFYESASLAPHQHSPGRPRRYTSWLHELERDKKSSADALEARRAALIARDQQVLLSATGPNPRNWQCGLYLKPEISSISINDTTAPSSALHTLSTTADKTALWNYFCSIQKSKQEPTKLGRGRDKDNIDDTGLTVDVGMSLLAENFRLNQKTCLSLKALSVADIVFEGIKFPTISTEALSIPLHEALWISLLSYDNFANDEPPIIGSPSPKMHRLWPSQIGLITRTQAFSCIIYFDSGHLNLAPNLLESVLAVSFQNSIYVAAVVLSDPCISQPPHSIHRITGNIGRGGICLLVAPKNPKIRPMGGDYRVVNHAEYDFRREDNFKGTSLHLSFTKWVHPLETGALRTVDQEVSFIESVISVHDRGVWVADLDIMGIDFTELMKLRDGAHKPEHRRHDESNSAFDYTSLDSWEEFLDGPSSVGIFRAHGNWAARLAAVSILFQKGQGHSVGLFDREEFCLSCLEERLMQGQKGLGDEDGEGMELERYRSYLPSFCID